MFNLTDRAWKPFSIIDIFDEIERGKRLKKNDHFEGERPYVSSSSKNNGVDQFVGNTEKVRTFTNCLSLANSGSVGSCFYEPFEFVASDHVTHLQKAGASQYIYLFLATTVGRLSEKYDFNREINDYRISREKIMLPVDDEGEPDYEFMNNYIKNIMIKKRKQYHEYIEKRIKEVGDVALDMFLEASKWKAVSIVSLFSRFEPGKGKGLNHLTQSSQGIPYIGATNRNNGVLCNVENNSLSHKMIQDGNCIGFIKNGDGSAGYAIYKYEPFISTSDIIYGYAEWLNRYTGLFFVATQDLIELKYSHGYKRNQQHLKGDKVMIPVTEEGKPNYEFMEQVGRKMMLEKYIKYRLYLDKYDTYK